MATLLLDQGIELVVIKELLGHSHIGASRTPTTPTRHLVEPSGSG
nr:hypothetical protein [Streptomyces phytophilus]